MGIDMEYGIWVIDMVIHHIDMVILDIDVGYGLMIWETTVSTWSSRISMWDMLSLWPCRKAVGVAHDGDGGHDVELFGVRSLLDVLQVRLDAEQRSGDRAVVAPQAGPCTRP